MDSNPRQTPPADSIVVLASTLDEGEDPSAIVQSNIAFLEMLGEEYIKEGEMCADALHSMYVDYFLAEYENGGFSQFVYNTRWDPKVIRHVREGLRAMGAKKLLKAFEKGAKMIDALGAEQLANYLDGEYFHEEGEEVEDPVDWEAIDEAIGKAADQDEVAELHGAWLCSHPRLFLLPTEEAMREEARRRGAALPDREERIARALAERPRFLKLIEALCAASGQTLDRLTTVNPHFEFEGEQVSAYHFLTNEGHHYMLEHEGKAFMFAGDSEEEVCSIDAPPDPVLH